MLAQLGPSDMRVPIAHCLAWPDRMATPMAPLDLVALGRLPRGDRNARAIEAALAATDTAALAERSVRTLSGGERARVLLARALAVGAPVLVADEPLASLDPAHQIHGMEILAAEARGGALVRP